MEHASTKNKLEMSFLCYATSGTPTQPAQARTRAEAGCAAAAALCAPAAPARRRLDAAAAAGTEEYRFAKNGKTVFGTDYPNW